MSRLPRREKGRHAAAINKSSPSHNAHFSIVQFYALRAGLRVSCGRSIPEERAGMLSAKDRVHAAPKPSPWSADNMNRRSNRPALRGHWLLVNEGVDAGAGIIVLHVRGDVWVASA